MPSYNKQIRRAWVCLLLLGALFSAVPAYAAQGVAMSEKKQFPMPPLTEREADIIVRKGTEAPYSGELLNSKGAGTYICRQCGVPLYRSTAKFESNCGWPAFDDAVPGAVRRVPDADGRRVEIVCNTCNGHLGHVFEGEGFTAKNTRHCVNSISMSFAPAGSEAEKAALALAASAKASGKPFGMAGEPAVQPAAKPAEALAIVAGGCFWGIEDAFRKMPGVIDAVSGYTGGQMIDPTYEAVSRGTTGHAEAVRVRFDPTKISYEQILRRFFEVHDPTQVNQQGPDVGTQYRSAVYYLDTEQMIMAQTLMLRLRELGYEVATQLEPATTFYEAEAYHQRFTERTGRGACHLSVKRFGQRADGSPVGSK